MKTKTLSWYSEAGSASTGKITQETSTLGTRRGCLVGHSRMPWVENGKLASLLLLLLELLFPTIDTWWR